MKTKLIFIILFLCFRAEAQKVRSYEINAEFFPEDAQMWGYEVSPDAFMRANSIVEFSDTPKEETVFYLHGELKIDSILDNGKRRKYSSEKVFYSYEYSNVALKVIIDSNSESNKLNIYYSGFFNPSRASSLSDYMRINKNEGVYLRSYGYSLWFPVFIERNKQSYKADFKSVSVKLPEKFKAIVTGKLVSEIVENGIYTALWKPGLIDICDVQCAAHDYKVISENNIYVYHYNNSNSEKNAVKILDYVIELKQLFSRSLIQIDNDIPIFINEMPKYGDISSANVVGIQTKVFNSFENDIHSKATIAHELVHPYVQIPISRKNEFYALIIEGFPSYFQTYALSKTLDKEAFNIEKYMKKTEKRYLTYRKTGKTRRGFKLPKEKPILKITADEIGTYKDKFVLNDRVYLFMYDLWIKMGNEKYDDFLKELFEFQSIDYLSFEKLVLKYIPEYQTNLNVWLNTTDFPEAFKIINK